MKNRFHQSLVGPAFFVSLYSSSIYRHVTELILNIL